MEVRGVIAQRYIPGRADLHEFDAALVAFVPVQAQQQSAYDGSLGPIETYIHAVVFDRATGAYWELPLSQIREPVTAPVKVT